ncbi:hypothetical protein DERP_008619, partial [Dermatophagoides pteronyssinus]
PKSCIQRDCNNNCVREGFRFGKCQHLYPPQVYLDNLFEYSAFCFTLLMFQHDNLTNSI